MNGAPDRARTCNLLIRSQTRSTLSDVHKSNETPENIDHHTVSLMFLQNRHKPHKDVQTLKILVHLCPRSVPGF